MSAEQFTRDQVVSAIDAFLQYAESEEGKSQHGYFSGGGWAARCLRAHKAVLESLRPADGVPPQLTSEQIKPLAAGSAFESEAFAQRIAAARDAQWLALRPAAQPASAPAAEPICPACNGSGEGAVLSGGGPDAYDVACVCQTCNGHGLVGGHMADGSGYGEGCPDCNPETAAQPVGEPVQPLLVRDVAEMTGCGVPEVSKALVSMGLDQRSTNMEVTPDEAVAVSSILRAAKQPVPAGYLMHWPAPGGGRDVLWSETGAEGRAIGCPVDQVFKFAEAQTAAVPVPTTEDQAAAMQMLGQAWLQQHAPHRLKAAQPVGEPVAPAAKFRECDECDITHAPGACAGNQEGAQP